MTLETSQWTSARPAILTSLLFSGNFLKNTSLHSSIQRSHWVQSRTDYIICVRHLQYLFFSQVFVHTSDWCFHHICSMFASAGVYLWSEEAYGGCRQGLHFTHSWRQQLPHTGIHVRVRRPHRWSCSAGERPSVSFLELWIPHKLSSMEHHLLSHDGRSAAALRPDCEWWSFSSWSSGEMDPSQRWWD